MSVKIKYAFRMTHIENIPHILQYGIVKADSQNRNPHYIPIGDTSVIKARQGVVFSKYIPLNSIPFYFGYRTPMLYVIQNGYNEVKKVHPQLIVYLVIKIEDIIKNNIDCVFTDGHALSGITSFYPKERLSDIDNIISPKDINATFWNGGDTDPDLKRRKDAELLIKEDLSPQFIKGFVVYNEKAKQILLSLGVADNKIIVNPDYYF